MLTKEQVLDAIKNGRESKCIDCRDFDRLADFFDVEHWGLFGFQKPSGKVHIPKEFTRENVLQQLAKDLAFGLEKAIDRRGLSTIVMIGVVLTWLWVLDDENQAELAKTNVGESFFRNIAKSYGIELA